MAVVSVCQEMGWTYDDYMEQPSWFISLLMVKLEIDARKTRESMRSRRKPIR